MTCVNDRYRMKCFVEATLPTAVFSRFFDHLSLRELRPLDLVAVC